MGWDRVIAQQRVVQGLQRVLSSGRVAHAYLFYGPEGSGKRAVALALAQALLCEREPAQRPCGECSACKRVPVFNHPDVQLHFPLPKDTPASDVRTRLDLLAKEPYATVDFVRRPDLAHAERGKRRVVQYGPKDINEGLRRTMALRSAEGGYKVAILTDVERMRAEAANAFLKLLEEPSRNTVFVLTATHVDRLLPTIVSRCQRLRFDRLEPNDIAQALQRRRGVDAAEARALARMADGSYARALDLVDSEALAQAREDVLVFMRRAYVVWARADEAALFIEQLARTSREHQQYVLALLLLWLRDLLIVQTGGAEESLVNADQWEPLMKFAESLPAANVEVMADLVEEAIRLLDRNVQAKLLLTTLMQQVSSAMHTGRARKLYEPLAGRVEG